MDVGNRTASQRQTGNQEWAPWEPEIIIRYELSIQINAKKTTKMVE